MAGDACFMPELYLSTCPIFPIRLIKTVRLRVEETEKLLLDPELGPPLKIVVLVRDPRGVMTSRSSMDWCQKPTCIDPSTVCQHLQSDVIAAFQLKKKYPGKLYSIILTEMFMNNLIFYIISKYNTLFTFFDRHLVYLFQVMYI